MTLKHLRGGAATLALAMAILAGGFGVQAVAAQQMLDTANCPNGDMVRMMIARDAVVVERRPNSNGLPSSVRSFDMWNFRAAQDEFAGLRSRCAQF